MTNRILAATAFALSVGCAPPVFAQEFTFDVIERGRQVAVASDCTACHTPPGGAFFSGGVGLDTPFGTLVGSNITPHEGTGIGHYSEEDLRRVLRDGIAPGNKRLYPAMPYTSYNMMSDEDITALYAYMRTVTPVDNAVESNQLPFPLNIRLAMIGWNILNFSGPQPFAPDPARSDEWNRGAYLTDALGHCGACHTPKNILFGDKTGKYLQGGVIEGWVAPDITSDPHRGIGAWTQDEIVDYLKQGVIPRSFASGKMADAVRHSTTHMSEPDLRAIALYLQSVPGRDEPAPIPVAADKAEIRAGQAVYLDRCAACHNSDGSGQTTIFPKLAGSSIVNEDDPATLIRVVLEGARAVATDIRPTAPAMPPFHWALSDAEMADVLTYIRNSWGNAAPAVLTSEVNSIRNKLSGK